ncbi:(Fe-S)-binding protein [Metabacillus arenae]|uniref:Lactate utilization protein A n=1 Tax=Metabacillus arenae TaxID=2771434 RepID=A0A926NFK0_9BACI|nr:(Fe-S)-binding protein [Metabacillus arenae]MBD1380351.1 (Fe-S)-binding protein [Metabacillus arenae]
MKVALFITCLVDMFQPRVGKSAVELLEHLGCEVEFPEEQICCGQPAFNSGYVKEAKESMKRMIQTFEKADYVVTPSGSCASMFKEYPHVFKEEPVWEEKAKALAEKTFELTEFIVGVLKVENVGASLTGRATYHTSCHMTRLLGIKDEPIKLLNQVKGLDYVPLKNNHDCCGFGGTFSVKMDRISEQMVEEKAAHIEGTEPDFLIGADCGCLMNIGGKIDRKGKPIKVLHIAEVLNHREERR